MDNLSVIERNKMIDEIMESEPTLEDRKRTEEYCKSYFELSKEAQEIEMDRIVKIIVTYILPRMVKEVGFKDGMVIKNSEYFNEDGTPKEQRRII